jgi:Xaa-Pro aminopeptidase
VRVPSSITSFPVFAIFAALAVLAVTRVGFGQESFTIRSPERSPERLADWTRPTFPAEEYATRRAAVVTRLKEDELLLVPSAEGTSAGETFRQDDDFEYLTGLEIPQSLLVIDGRARQSVLFVPKGDPRFDNPGRPNDFPGRPLQADSALRTLSAVDRVSLNSDLPAFLDSLVPRGARVLINLGGRPSATPSGPAMFGALSPGPTLAAYLRTERPTLAINDAYPLLAALRMVKSEREIAVMRRAAQITAAAIARGAARVGPGVAERTLTGAFVADCMAGGAQRAAFTPIIKSGPNSLWPWRILGAHYDRRNRVMAAGEMVIYDVGCELDHYVSDVGRTFPVSERFTLRQRELVDMVRRISDAVIAAAKPGTTMAGLQKTAAAAIPDGARPYMQAPLYFGHHLGLDSGDPFLATAPLMPGMILTIEPWYYNHLEAAAVFIEDEILITPTGRENLTAALPRDPDGLERLRQNRRPLP